MFAAVPEDPYCGGAGGFGQGRQDIRQDFFPGRSFRNLDDLNAQLADWLDTVANVRIHGTTQRVVADHTASVVIPGFLQSEKCRL